MLPQAKIFRDLNELCLICAKLDTIVLVGATINDCKFIAELFHALPQRNYLFFCRNSKEISNKLDELTFVEPNRFFYDMADTTLQESIPPSLNALVFLMHVGKERQLLQKLDIICEKIDSKSIIVLKDFNNTDSKKENEVTIVSWVQSFHHKYNYELNALAFDEKGIEYLAFAKKQELNSASTTGIANITKKPFDRRFPIIHVHVPKTAGVSFYQMLKRAYPKNFHVKFEDVDNSWFDFIKKHAEIDFVTGHVFHKHLVLLENERKPFNALTFLRDPIRRKVSHYYYCCSEQHLWHDDFIKQFPTFEDYIREPSLWNEQTRWLVGDEVTNVSIAIEKIRDTFCFVGLVEFMDDSINLLGQIINKKFPMIYFRNQNESKPLKISPELQNIVLMNEGLDVGIYEYFKKGYLQNINSNLKIELSQNSAPNLKQSQSLKNKIKQLLKTQ